jgi:hypothetical protein
MSASRHTHEWVRLGPPGSPEIRCACGASIWAVQSLLGAVAEDARSAAGDSYFTGCRLDQASETLELWLADAPDELLQRLEALHPGVYVIHNDAPRPLGAVEELRGSLDWWALKAEGIEVTEVGPSPDGYLRVGVLDDVEGAQAKLDAIHGHDVVRVHQGARFVSLPARPRS